ncbi:hypothetical protein PT974_12032 [Cladobotryum mycophilum]|uniref:Protein kinase domain-containing protein n=1 Tax=Cladobotryum mycophilum TaxID=491253 RepID=A0ABR0S6W8_9HYPO
MESNNPTTQDFELLTQIDDALCNRPLQPPDYPDQEGRTSDAGLAFHDLMYVMNQAPVIAQIFNHENIVSIVGHIKVRPFVGTAAAGDEQLDRPTDFIVWDFCDAANLSALFEDTPLKSSQQYMPESLCWHVLTSLMRAVTYLHDGKRLFFDPRAKSTESKKWIQVDHDWNPILHRAIEPRNIFFQHPQGTETYGMCKLGSFENAAVTNHIISPGDGPKREEIDNPSCVAIAPRRGWEPWNITRDGIDKDPESFETESSRPYTLADELWSLGAVIFTMMTGQKPVFCCSTYGCCHITTCSQGGCLQNAAARKGCNCAMGGCKHIPNMRCTHEELVMNRPVYNSCLEPIVNIDSHLTQARYSWRLRKVVKDLLYCDPSKKVMISKILPFTKIVMEYYRDWKEGAEDGEAYRDIEDDMAARWEAGKKEKARTVHVL